ncbi:MAG: hypothetical protein ACP5O8_03845 [Candidatus Aenigmatarchaeota archaeon]
MSRKAQTLEIIEILILVVGVIVILSILYFRYFTLTESQKDLLVREQIYNRVSDAIITFQSSKIYGTEKSLASIVSDAVVSGNLTVDYGKGYGVINVSKILPEFFENYFDKKWKFMINVPKEWVNVALLLDTSGSLKDEVDVIKSKIEEINLIALKKKIKLKIYTLRGTGSRWGCEIFSNTKLKDDCYELVGCPLLKQTEEDWGNGLKCLIEKFNLTAVIIITDELTTGSDVCLCTNGNLMGNFSQSFDNGLKACKSQDVSVFTLKGNFSTDECPNVVDWKKWCDHFYPSFSPQPTKQSCELCGVKKVVEALKNISTECNGKYFDLELTNPAEAVEEVVKIIPSKPPVIFGYEVPPSTNTYTFQISLPYPNYEGETIKSELIVW